MAGENDPIGIRDSVRSRLLLAFLGICAFAVIAALVAMYSFSELGRVISHITSERVPPAIASLELSRQAERVANAAPALLAATKSNQREEVSRVIATEVERLDALLSELKISPVTLTELADVEPAIDALRQNLSALDKLVSDRLEASEKIEELLRRLARTHINAQRLISPGILVMDSKFSEWSRISSESPDGDDRAGGLAQALAAEVGQLMPHQKIQIEISAINDSLIKAAAAETPADIKLVALPAERALAQLEKLNESFSQALQPRISREINAFRSLLEGPDSILRARERELAIISEGEALLSENNDLSRQVGEGLDRLVAASNRDIELADLEAQNSVRLSSAVLIGTVIMSLLCSILIVWLYVDRSLIARLTMLSRSMFSISRGDLRTTVPESRGKDEIDHMITALNVFRDTAIEVEENNLREVAQARTRLIDAIESISEGFAFFDADDRLQICNTRFRDLMFGDGDMQLAEGETYANIVEKSAISGLYGGGSENSGDYIDRCLKQHRIAEEPILEQRTDGRWILRSERKVSGGGTVAVHSDITELKQREQDLAEKSNALERLSSQLAKYLSPQVYESIFTGQQEVKVSSHRKKLTVFFSDIAGFTTAAERLESEELTQLLNHYLTEMSRIALDYGATIDKYVGDAIVAFFGDPMSIGVKEDALACVKMAIAMREKMHDLETLWRDAGIEEPLRCRIGIHTGFCTVGNFGSEDRLDYTIVGPGVNLASRLETMAEPGEILISYETYALVKDEIACEDHGQVEVRGISYPVTTYQVVDTLENLEDADRSIRKDYPKFKLRVDLASMSSDERIEAEELLRQALDVVTSSR